MSPAWRDLGPGTHHLPAAEGSTDPGLIVIRGLDDGPHVAIVAGIHGDEHEGPLAALELVDGLAPRDVAGTLVVIPVAHPAAIERGTRLSPIDGLDLNRSFPGDPVGTATQRLAARLFREVATQVDVVVTVHGWSAGYLTLPYAEYARTSPRAAESRALAHAAGLGRVEGLDDRPGRLLATSGAAGRVAVELEVGGEGVSLRDRRETCLAALQRMLAHAGTVAAVSRPVESRSIEIDRHVIDASHAGLLRRVRECGDRVEAGDTLAQVTDMMGRTLEVVTAPVDGTLGLLREACHVNSGELVAGVYQEAG